MVADEPKLPSLPLASTRASIPNGERPGKRVRLDTSPVSSDPPFFSSDDDPSADNYSASNGRQKRRFRGPWYNQQPEDKKTKRTLQRQFDSAVWLGSDITQEDDDAEFSDRVHLPSIARDDQESTLTRLAGVHFNATQVSRGEPAPEDLAEKEIGLCLEAGNENIDLSSRGLTRLSNVIIRPLSTIVAIPLSSQGASYHTLRPTLKLFLSSNMLRRVPGEIFNLENLSVLSLRSNLLVDIPSGIGRLRRLVELNVANNHLHFLPYEILDLLSESSKLHSLQIHPNPFYEPDDADAKDKRCPYPPDLRDGVVSQSGRPGAVSCILPEPNAKWNVKRKFRSHVRFMNIDGTLVKGPNFPRDQSLFSSPPPQRNAPNYSHYFGGSNLIPVAPADDVPEPPTLLSSIKGAQPSKAPSLLEVAVSTWSQSPELPDLGQWLGYDAPERLDRVMEDARVLRETEAEARKCTICKRRFVIPRTEWIEWWQMSKAQDIRGLASPASPLRQTENRRDQVESMVPLMRRGCSWRCTPEGMLTEDNVEASTE